MAKEFTMRNKKLYNELVAETMSDYWKHIKEVKIAQLKQHIADVRVNIIIKGDYNYA